MSNDEWPMSQLEGADSSHAPTIHRVFVKNRSGYKTTGNEANAREKIVSRKHLTGLQRDSSDYFPGSQSTANSLMVLPPLIISVIFRS